MAWPSTSTRTKTWGTEILTASDLQGQLDLLHTYNNDQLNGTTGHGHTGGTNDGPKLSLTGAVSGILPVANGGTGLASYGVGDIPYASASTTIAKLSPSSAGQALSSAGATTAPVFAGMTTQGDIEYFDGTTRQRLAPGTANQVLKTGGAGANPSWTFTGILSILDYGTSASASTQRGVSGATVKYCYGQTTDDTAISNLPFASSTSYTVTAIMVSGTITQNVRLSSVSASGFTVGDGLGSGNVIHWHAIGT